MNVAINRDELIRYAAKGNGEIIPALLPVYAFGYDPKLVPYPFDPNQECDLLRDAGYADGLAITLIAPEQLEIQAIVIGNMLEGSASRWSARSSKRRHIKAVEFVPYRGSSLILAETGVTAQH